MLQTWIIVFATLAYIGLLFGIAYYADSRADHGRSVIANPYIYSLSLAVYATAWTFYGSVGRAAGDGIGFLPIYIGPTLMMVLWWFVVRKMIRISKLNRITSLADFIASRYGKSALLGGVVTIIAVVGILPYISLQLKAVSSSFHILAHYPQMAVPARPGTLNVLGDTAFYIAMLLAFFAIMFGTRNLDAAERHEGMVAAIAFESIVKLVAFLAVGLFVTFGVFDGFGDLFGQAQQDPRIAPLMTPFSGGVSFMSWVWLTILSMLAIIFLPRQFQVAVIENVHEKHLSKAVWLFPLYMLAINFFVLPIAFGGLLLLPRSVDADTFVLTLPLAHGHEILALLVFIGGVSAATGMVIVETIALATMISNHIVMPIALRIPALALAERQDISSVLLGSRRASILAILLLGYFYYVLAGEAYALVSIGLISFAAVAQFAPAAIGGIYWKGGTRTGALAGLCAGFGVWLYTLLVPAVANSGWFGIELVERGPWGIELLRPTQLFGLGSLDQITHSMLWSMMANIGCYVLFSMLSRQTVVEYSQASLFVDVFLQSGRRGITWRGKTSVAALQKLLGRFLSPARARELFAEHKADRLMKPSDELQADARLVQFVEAQLAGHIGAASARAMVATVAQEEPVGIAEVMTIIDEASQVIAYSHQLEGKQRELEEATAELKAANARLQDLDHLKDDFISTVSHELRTPLTSIRACSEILADNPDLEMVERERFLSLIIKESERLTRLINQMLDIAKLESGHAEWSSAEVDLRDLVTEAIISTSPLFKGKGIRVETRLSADIDLVHGDRDRLTQVMLNLLSNAAKFCPDIDGLVEVRVVRDGDSTRVDVSDNGIGISARDQKHIFEKFRQGGNAMTQKPEGTGLGLAICRQIIGHSGGRLWVESAAGCGSIFSFTLPSAGRAPRASLAAE